VPPVEVTTTVNVTGWPNVEGLAEEVSVVLDAARSEKADVPRDVPSPVGLS
jgi:hypothetical protein